jgi:NAD-dependent deacetylase
MKKLVVLSGAGMSAESGLRTFREMGGLWEEYDVYEVASPAAWQKDRALVLRFYNERRKQLFEVEPNRGHLGLAELEKDYEVWIVTQNVDDLHERAGSSRILHLHGELKKSRSTADPSLIYEIEGWKLEEGDLCERVPSCVPTLYGLERRFRPLKRLPLLFPRPIFSLSSEHQ